jgi:hypothetical protein
MLDTQDSSGWGSREGPQQIQSSYNLRANYASSNFDIRQALKGYVVYNLPFGKGAKYLNNSLIANEIVGGWQISGTVLLSTGNPFGVNSDQNPYANGSGAFPNLSGQSISVTGKNARCSNQVAGATCVSKWYNPEAFLNPGNGHFGSVGRNNLNGPGINTFNMSAHKDFMLFEGWGHVVNLQIRGDAQNVWNHASFSPPSNSLQGSGGAGTVYTSSGGGSNQISGTTIGGRNLAVSAHITF